MEHHPPLLLFISLISMFIKHVISNNTLTLNNSLTDGQTLVSPTEVFELGFFGNGSRYLGMWYKTISHGKVVWVANRETPVRDLSGVLRINSSGNLVLEDGVGNVIWSTNTSLTATDPIAELLDSGNLLLRNNNSENQENYLWQSFDFPSHTLLPGMKMGWTSKDGVNRYLTSWKSETDPSPGDFSVGIEDPVLPQMIIRRKSAKHIRVGPYNGNRFSGGPALKGQNTVIKFVYETNEVYYIDQPAYEFAMIRFELNPSGLFRHTYWNYAIQSWSIAYVLGEGRCDSYNKCGENGVCKSILEVCQCMNGFTPTSPNDWSLGNYSGGCVREKTLNCAMGDEFRTFTRLQLPDTLNYQLNKNINLDDCKAECTKNCTCMAYASSNMSTGSGCILWFDNLVDLQEFDDSGQELYIRMGSSDQESIKGDKLEAKVIVPVVVSGVLVLVMITCYIGFKRRSKAKGIIEDNEGILPGSKTVENLELPLFDIHTVETATNHFALSNKIGEGGFGTVYKGVLTTGEEIAIKTLSKDSKQGLQEFMNEVVLMAKLQHRNLVRLLGCCIYKDERMLIYEYMPNKSLDFIIFDKTRSRCLDWKTRFNIIVGIARGLLYLHRDSRLRIIHRDLKASNILLDSQLNPKISDFGLAKLFGGDQTEENTRRVVGTYGYMSPEYATDGIFSMKSDVFSFGVLVLEIISGEKNRGFNHSGHHLNLLGHTWKLLADDSGLELVEASIRDSIKASEVLTCIQVGLLCVQKFPEDRPAMSSVVSMLGSDDDVVLPCPKEPGFYTERSAAEYYSSSTQGIDITQNGATVTLLTGR